MGCACGKDTCGCSAPQVVYLQDEEGNAHPFYVSDRVQTESGSYAFLVSTEDDQQYALLRVEQDSAGREFMVNITDEAEWNQLQQSLFGPVQA